MRKTLILVYAAMLSASADVLAYDPDVQMQLSIAMVANIIQVGRANFVNVGTPQVRAADSHISFVVDQSPIPNAFEVTGPSGDHGVIHMSNSLHVLLLYLADVTSVTRVHPTFQNCANAYNEYLITTVSQNKELFFHAQPLKYIQPPEEFIATAKPLCNGFDNAFPIEVELRPERDAEVQYLLMIVYLHELGHFALHHSGVTAEAVHTAVGGTVNTQALSELARSRTQEFEADAWGYRQFLRMYGFPFEVVVLDLLRLLQIVGNSFDCTGDAVSTHPDGLERFAALVPIFQEEYKNKTGMNPPPVLNDLLNDTVTLSEHARDQLHCGKGPVAATSNPHDYGNCYADHRCFAVPTPFHVGPSAPAAPH